MEQKIGGCEVEFSKNNKFKGRIYTDAVTGEFLILDIKNGIYGIAHEGNPDTLTSIKQKAVETQETLAVTRTEETQDLSVGALRQFPSIEAEGLIIKRHIKDINSAPSQKISKVSIELPEKCKYYGENNERFVTGDSELGDNGRILIFGKAGDSDWIHLVKKLRGGKF